MTISDKVAQELDACDESELCAQLGAVIEVYGLATVQRALAAINAAGTWERT
jgi:hypothetical protein